jgi:molecular chaperone DnaK
MEPKIEVAFRIDENGILSVRARDADSGIQQGIRIEDPLGLQQVEPAADESPAAANLAGDDDSSPRQSFEIER